MLRLFLKKFIPALVPLTLLLFPANAKAAKGAFDFYGHTVYIDYGEQFSGIRYTSNAAELIKRFDENGNAAQTLLLVKEIRHVVKELNLDDIGKSLLVNAFAENVFTGQTKNFKTLVKWYILYHDSMDVMLCYDAKNITLYGRTDIKPYGAAYINKGGKTYTDLSFGNMGNAGGKVFEYQPKGKALAGHIFTFNRTVCPNLNALTITKNYTFEFAGKKYTLNSTINQSLAMYLHDLPNVELGTTYVNYGFSATVEKTLIQQLRKITATMSQREALGFLLKFVQEIPYKTDEEYWGKEHYSYCEEVLYNEYADCEDKTVLYAALVKELLNMQSVALMYGDDEHVAIALKMPAGTANYTFMYNNELYLAAEPAGENYELGQLGFETKKVTDIVELF